jgi:hypothetical protein
MMPLVTITLSDTPVNPVIQASLEKGAFRSSTREWTLYRRNFFVLRASFSINECALHNYTPDGFRIGAQTVTGFKTRTRAENENALPIELS